MAKHFYHTWLAALCVSSVVASVSPVLASDWETDFDKGLKTAEATNRPALVELTGSDWCPGCKYLRSHILDTPEFAACVEKNGFVLVELDFPRTPGKITPELMRTREEIMRRYDVNVFPTVLLMNAKGEPYAKIVGATKTPEEYLEKLQSAQSRKKEFDKAVADAGKLSSQERADALVAALRQLPDELQGYQAGLIAEIVKHDPQDKYGFQKKQGDVRLLAEQRQMLENFFAGSQGKMKPNEIDQSREEALKILEKPDLLPIIRLQLYKYVSDGYALQRNLPKALEYLKAACDAAPGTRESERLKPWADNMERIIKGTAD